MFQKHTRYFFTSVTKSEFSSFHLKSIGVYIHTEDRKRPWNPTDSPLVDYGETCSDIIVFHFRLFIEVESKLVAGIIFHPYFLWYFFGIDSLNFSLLSIIQKIIQSEKFKGPFHSERPYNSENETENTVREGENHTRISLISLTRLTLSKYYLTLDIYSCKHQYFITVLMQRISVIKFEASCARTSLY